MGALFGECVLNRESHYIRRWRLTNTSDTIVILSLTHQTEFGLLSIYLFYLYKMTNNVQQLYMDREKKILLRIQ